MRNKLKKGVSLALAGIMILGSFTPVIAKVDETQTTSTSETLTTDVLYNQDSSFTVTIPKLITLDNEKKADYTITITGDIASDEVVNVVPDESFEMIDQATTGIRKNNVTATVKQDKTIWMYDKFETKGNGSVEALGLTSGNWKGSFWFNISLTNHTHKYEEAIIKDSSCTEIGIKTFTCKCEYIYQEDIELKPHNWNEEYCTICGIKQEAGLYDANGAMLCTWSASGIDATKDYSNSTTASNYYETTKTSPYYVLTNIYPNTTKIVIPATVSSIGNYAFYGCTKLKNISIPDNVINIGDSSFNRCTKLESITIPDNVTSIGNSAFYKCTGLKNVTIGNGVTSIGYWAFSDCTKLTSITIPSSVTQIGNYAFYYCSNLSNIAIGNNVTSIGVETFGATKWLTEKQTENPLVIVNGILIDGTTASGDVTIPDSVIVIGSCAFEDCTGLTSITIPNSVETIEGSAFKNCVGLTSITIPDSVASIKGVAFQNCSSLTSITIPDNVTSIGNYTFQNCSSLTSITIPDNVTSIGNYAFTGCTSLNSVTFEDTETWYVGSSAGATTTQVTVTNATTNATYLTSTYKTKFWTKTE